MKSCYIIAISLVFGFSNLSYAVEPSCKKLVYVNHLDDSHSKIVTADLDATPSSVRTLAELNSSDTASIYLRRSPDCRWVVYLKYPNNADHMHWTWAIADVSQKIPEKNFGPEPIFIQGKSIKTQVEGFSPDSKWLLYSVEYSDRSTEKNGIKMFALSLSSLESTEIFDVADGFKNGRGLNGFDPLAKFAENSKFAVFHVAHPGEFNGDRSKEGLVKINFPSLTKTWIRHDKGISGDFAITPNGDKIIYTTAERSYDGKDGGKLFFRNVQDEKDTMLNSWASSAWSYMAVEQNFVYIFDPTFEGGADGALVRYRLDCSSPSEFDCSPVERIVSLQYPEVVQPEQVEISPSTGKIVSLWSIQNRAEKYYRIVVSDPRARTQTNVTAPIVLPVGRISGAFYDSLLNVRKKSLIASDDQNVIFNQYEDRTYKLTRINLIDNSQKILRTYQPTWGKDEIDQDSMYYVKSNQIFFYEKLGTISRYAYKVLNISDGVVKTLANIPFETSQKFKFFTIHPGFSTGSTAPMQIKVPNENIEYPFEKIGSFQLFYFDSLAKNFKWFPSDIRSSWTNFKNSQDCGLSSELL